MTAAVWTDERIREAFIYDGGEAEYHDPIRGAQTQRQVAGSIFDAWLAAHDVALLATVSTPPADDVRELVDHLNGLMDSLDESVAHDQIYQQLQVAWNMARALRPRGTVTDAEGAWEYGVRHVAVDGWPTERVHVSLNAAREDLDTCGMNCHLIRRRSAQDAGAWEPVDATGEARS